MTRFALTAILLLSACAGSNASTKPSSLVSTTRPTSEKLPNIEGSAPAPDASAPTNDVSYNMSLPDSWMLATTDDGSTAVLHLVGTPPQPDGSLQIAYESADGIPVAEHARLFRNDLIDGGLECTEVVPSEDNSYASFDVRKLPDGPPTMYGTITIRPDPGNASRVIGCLGRWTKSVHDKLSAESVAICKSISVAQRSAP